jgi:hypothetical protein
VIAPFGTDEIDRSIPEATVLYVSRLLHTMDRTAYETALQLARVEAHRRVAAEAAEATRQDRENQRGIARTAPTMGAEDAAAIHRIVTERRCSGIEAAVLLGQQREAAKADEQ